MAVVVVVVEVGTAKSLVRICVALSVVKEVHLVQGREEVAGLCRDGMGWRGSWSLTERAGKGRGLLSHLQGKGAGKRGDPWCVVRRGC